MKMNENFNIRRLTEADRESFRRLMRYAYDPSQNSYKNLDYPSEKLPMDLAYGTFDGDLLVAGLIKMPYEIKLRSQEFKMHGISSVATKPEYRNRGLIRELMTKMFEVMHNNNITLSILFPAKPSVYTRLGYRLVDEKIYYHFKITDIKYQKTDYRIVEVDKIDDDFRYVYDKAMINYDYIAKRPNIDYWRRHFKWNYKFICYNNNQPVGYLIINFPRENAYIGGDSWIKYPEKSILIKEVFWLDHMAKQTIFNFLWAHRDHNLREYIAGAFPATEVIIDLLKTPRILEGRILDNSYLRIIDVKTVLENLTYTSDDLSLSFKIHDEFCPWNNGIFTVAYDNEKIKVEFSQTSDFIADIDLDISYFAQLVAGFRTVKELLNLGFISVNPEHLELLQNQFPKKNNYFSEYF